MTTPYRVGLIVPSSNVTMETEIPALLSRHPAMARRGVTFHSSRAALHRVDPESLRRMVAESDRCARELADARLDVVAYACLIAIMAGRPRGARGGRTAAGRHARRRRIRRAGDEQCGGPGPGPAAARRQPGGHRDPVPEATHRMVIDYLAGYGITVADSVSLEVADNVDVGRLDPADLSGHVRRLDLTGVDALVLSACVQMPSLAALDEVRRQTQVPVLSAATATAGEVLALLGQADGTTTFLTSAM